MTRGGKRPGAGRKPAGEPRTVHLGGVRLPPSKLAAYHEAAERAGETLTAWVETALDHKLLRSGTKAPKPKAVLEADRRAFCQQLQQAFDERDALRAELEQWKKRAEQAAKGVDGFDPDHYYEAWKSGGKNR